MTNHPPTNALSHAERLRRLGSIRRLFESGKGGFVYPIRYVWFAEPSDTNSAEVLFNVPKKFQRRANKRNLLRRRVKEAYRLQKGIILEGGGAEVVGEESPLRALDIALIYSTKEEHSYKTIHNAVRKILEQIAQHH